jgi:hypothetical protein
LPPDQSLAGSALDFRLRRVVNVRQGDEPVPDTTRRRFLTQTPATAALAATLFPDGTTPAAAEPSAVEGTAADWLPRQDPAVVQEMVAAAHGNLSRVRELLERQPALVNATVDWGFGDWETALGGSSHMGNRDIADLLLAHGAQPTIFSAAMLGQLDVVKAMVAARPGIQRVSGPHGITLLAHARAGKADGEPVLHYLDGLGDADLRPPTVELERADRDRLVGEYIYRSGVRDRFVVDVDRDQLGIARPGTTRRLLFHHGQLVFFPSGVPSVKIAFAHEDGVVRMTVANPDVLVTASRR